MALPGFSFAPRLRAGETVFCGWCSMPYPIVAETIGRDGFVAVTLESQHGLWDMGAMLTGIAAVRQSGAAPLVRVPFPGCSGGWQPRNNAWPPSGSASRALQSRSAPSSPLPDKQALRLN